MGVLLILDLVLIFLIALPLVQARSAQLAMAPTPADSPTVAPSTTPPPLPSAAAAPSVDLLPTAAPPTPGPQTKSGMIFLSLQDGAYSHLFAYHPENLPLKRMTYGEWDDISPALSPDGNYLAFASDRSGYWDLYLMELWSGMVTPLTQTPEYDGAPAWSPDGTRLVHETYLDGNLELAVLDVQSGSRLFMLTQQPAADLLPSWSADGRRIAFVSISSEQQDIWLADLDKNGPERLTNLTQTKAIAENHPAWSPDGTQLAWAAAQNGLHSLYLSSFQGEPQQIGSGNWPVWDPTGKLIATTLVYPHQTFLSAYSSGNAALALPPINLPNPVSGMTWGQANLPSTWPELMAEAANLSPTPAWLAVVDSSPDVPASRQGVVDLESVNAPYPQLHDQVDEAFSALRSRLAAETGWDLLADLENAFVPLTTHLAPGLGADWLYTGRAFSFNPLPINAGWMVVIPEQHGVETYWRVFLKARFQDGSQGKPLTAFPWDFNARYSGDTLLYEQGGARQNEIPGGYWVDLTSLAAAYGWERLPALPNWRSTYHAARFNELVITGGLDWKAAMLELYPSQALPAHLEPEPGNGS